MTSSEIGAHAKMELLVHGLRISRCALDGLGTHFKEYQYGYNDTNWGGTKRMKLLPSELVLPGNIVVAPHIRPDSPYKLTRSQDELVVFNDLNNTILTQVEYLERPHLWDECLSDGTSVKEYINVYGSDCLNIFVYAKCEFWEIGMPCSFCSLKPTQTRHSAVKIRKSPEHIREAVEISFRGPDRLEWMIVTGGSMTSREEEVAIYCRILTEIAKVIPSHWKGKIRGNCALLPGTSDRHLWKLYEVGVEHPSFNLEVWGKDRFAQICPGKQRYVGFENILDLYRKASRIWGYGQVWCNFVGGLTPLKEIKEGFRYLAEMGIVPGANIFHPDPGAPAGRIYTTPSRMYIEEMYGFLGELYHTYEFKPFFNAGVLRNSLANEFYYGWI